MKCPGQDSRYWQPGAIFEVECPECGKAVEFFRDEPTRKCKGCGKRVVNTEMDFGCAAYCKYAEQCLGDLPPELLAQRDELLKDRVAIAMKRYFKQDFRRIGHATRVARYAEKLVMQERGDPAIVLTAAYLHDIGIKEAERKYNSTSAKYQEEEGPPITREILSGLGASEDLIEEVCDIVGHHHHPRAEETINFKAVYDADLITNLEEAQRDSGMDPKKLETTIEGAFLTHAGRQLARNVLLGGSS
jgi:endogenous inhibitor of DNA gyrase (YacG/DUF329 family)